MRSRTARRLSSAVRFGRGFPMIRLRSPATAMVPKRDSTCQRIRDRFKFMVLTSNVSPSEWDEFFTGDDTLLCALCV